MSNTVPLFNGDQMPLVGYGTWKLPKDKCAESVELAIQKGYKAIDTACDYGNETFVGEGIRNAIEKGYASREELFVTSKLWNTYHHKEHVLPACKKTLEDLGLEYLDLYLIHFPLCLKYVDFEERYPPEWLVDPNAEKPEMVIDPVPLRETWEAMEQLVELGLVKHIGVANFSNQLVMDLLTWAKVRPSVNQVEMHPYLQQKYVINYCQKKDIVVTAYSSFGNLSYKSLDGFKIAHETENVFDNAILQSIAQSHNKTVAQVILRWQVQQNVTVIPKSQNEGRIEQNMDIFDFELSDDEITQIKTIDSNIRFNDPGWYAGYPIFD